MAGERSNRSPDNNPNATPGLLGSLSTMATTLVAIVHTRLELLATDLEEDTEHLLSLLIMTMVALFALGVGVILATLLIVAAFWETHRLLALGSLAILFLAVGITAAVMAVHKTRTKPRIFTSSLLELFKDRERLSNSEHTP